MAYLYSCFRVCTYIILYYYSTSLFSTDALFASEEIWSGPDSPMVYKYYDDESMRIIDFEWNPDTEPWLRFHLRICGTFCNGTEAIKLGEVIFAVCSESCFPCDCEMSCSIYGTCCPGVSPDTPLAPRDRKQYVYSKSYAPVYFVGKLEDYDFVDNNVYNKIVKENPELHVDVQFQGRFHCLTTSWMSEFSTHYYAITDCPEEGKNDTLRQLCEATDINTVTIDCVTPVTDVRNGILFKNRYCLQCNVFNESNTDYIHLHDEGPDVFASGAAASAKKDVTTSMPYRKWKVGIFCKHYQQFYMLESADEFLRAVLKDAKENVRSPCHVKFEPPDSQVSPRNCMVINSEESPQGEVHATGDCIADTGVFRNISHLCHSLTAEAFRIYQRQNTFCYMCVYDFPTCIEARDDLRPYVTSPLSFLLGESSAVTFYSDSDSVPGRNGEEDVYLCKDPLEWMDEKNNCRQPECSRGKRLRDGQCVTIVDIVTRLGYKVTAVLRLGQNVHQEEAATLVDQILDEIFNSTGTSGALEVNMAVYGTKGSNLDNHVRYVTLKGYLVSDQKISRDDFESNFLNHSFTFISKSEESDETVVLSPSPVYIGADTTKYMHALFPTDPSQCSTDSRGPTRNRHQNVPAVKETSKNSTRLSTLVLKCVDMYSIESMTTLTAPTGDDAATKFVEYRKKRYAQYAKETYDSIWDMKSSFIDLTHSLLCPYVSFGIIQINFSPNSGEVDIQFEYRDKPYSIDAASQSYRHSVSIIDRKLLICVNTFRKEFQKVEDHISPNATFTISITEKAKRYFTLVCFMLSAVCLGLTITTYSVFSELRTLPGLNTLMLSISLAIAQIFLVVVVESVGYIDGWLCMALGMGVHYSWLVACQWMSVCCYHMFTVFRGIETRSSSSQVKNKFEWYCFYAFGSSAVIVALTIILSEIISGSKTTGYNPRSCIFNNAWSHLVALLSFVLPVGLISLSNLVMFVITVREIMAVTCLQQSGRMKGRDGVVTYVKLSSLTGLFWLLTILAARLNNTVLDFLSIPFVALQGVFIFLSFTFNANTKRLFCKMLCRSKDSTAKSSTASPACSATTTTTAAATTRVSLIVVVEDDGNSHIRSSPADV